MLRIQDRHERDMLFGPTNEEMITEIFRAYARSYKDLPLNLYHIQLKFRDEIAPALRAMRSREFLMKDAYSFDLDLARAPADSYNKMFAGLSAHLPSAWTDLDSHARTPAHDGGDLGHEFIILANTGESEVFCDRGGISAAGPAGRCRFRQRASAARYRQRRSTALCRDERDA
jgi:prolyl-tRNA synthetase